MTQSNGVRARSAFGIAADYNPYEVLQAAPAGSASVKPPSMKPPSMKPPSVTPPSVNPPSVKPRLQALDPGACDLGPAQFGDPAHPSPCVNCTGQTVLTGLWQGQDFRYIVSVDQAQVRPGPDYPYVLSLTRGGGVFSNATGAVLAFIATLEQHCKGWSSDLTYCLDNATGASPLVNSDARLGLSLFGPTDSKLDACVAGVFQQTFRELTATRSHSHLDVILGLSLGLGLPCLCLAAVAADRCGCPPPGFQYLRSAWHFLGDGAVNMWRGISGFGGRPVPAVADVRDGKGVSDGKAGGGAEPIAQDFQNKPAPDNGEGIGDGKHN